MTGMYPKGGGGPERVKRFLRRLRERKLFEWGLAYLAGAWVLLQGIDILADPFGWPPWVQRSVTVLLAVGFAAALVLAWYHGDLGRQAISRVEGIMLVALLVIAGGVLALVRTDGEADGMSGSAPGAGLEATAGDANAGSNPGTSADTGPMSDRTSVAVLPFVNMSADSENAYFADGVSEEILNLLARVGGLRVAGRTSSFSFRDRQEDLREIGRQLGVTHILEGSVRRDGDRVRITAQLVEADGGFHLWSEIYDRELTDVFRVQEEIGAAIAGALRGALLQDTEGPRVATTGVEAYNHYLRAQSLLARRGAGNLRAARTEFEASLDRDSAYVPALVGLARTLVLTPVYARLEGDSATAMTELAARLARRAIELDPADARAHAVLGTVYTFHDWRWSAAAEAFARALELGPDDAEIVNFAGDYYRSALDAEKALALERRAVRLDPLHPVNHWDLAWTYLALGDFENAIVYAKSAQALSPESIDPYGIMVWSYGRLGRFEEMRAARRAAREHTREAEQEYLQLDVWAAIATDDRAEGLRLQSRLVPHAEAGEYSSALLGYQYLLLGESGRAAEWLERAYRRRDAQLAFAEPIDFGRIDADPGARAVLEHPELQELFEIRKRNARARTGGEELTPREEGP